MLMLVTLTALLLSPSAIPEKPVSGETDDIEETMITGEIEFPEQWTIFVPEPDPESWTDRNNFPAWGLAQTSPTELSMYWTEHYRHSGMRLRRGTLRLDGFASLTAEDKVGEMLTQPLVFSGTRLEVNFATSAGGTIRLELCDIDGKPYEGFSLEDSDIVFGNEIDSVVTWNNSADLSELVSQLSVAHRIEWGTPIQDRTWRALRLPALLALSLLADDCLFLQFCQKAPPPIQEGNHSASPKKSLDFSSSSRIKNKSHARLAQW